MGKEIKIIIIIVIILYIISNIISPGFINIRYRSGERDKYSKYECGEEILNIIKEKEELYIKYYMIALTYLLFDIEIVLLFPLISYLLSYNNIINYLFILLLFFFFVLLGLLFEYFYGLFN